MNRRYVNICESNHNISEAKSAQTLKSTKFEKSALTSVFSGERGEIRNT